MLGGNVELRERLLDLLELDVAALRDVPGAVERVLHFAEQLHHLVARLQVEVGRVQAHAVRVADMVLPVWMHSRISCARASSLRR